MKGIVQEVKEGFTLLSARVSGSKDALDKAQATAAAGEVRDFASEDDTTNGALGVIIGWRHGRIGQEMPHCWP